MQAARSLSSNRAVILRRVKRNEQGSGEGNMQGLPGGLHLAESKLLVAQRRADSLLGPILRRLSSHTLSSVLRQPHPTPPRDTPDPVSNLAHNRHLCCRYPLLRSRGRQALRPSSDRQSPPATPHGLKASGREMVFAAASRWILSDLGLGDPRRVCGASERSTPESSLSSIEDQGRPRAIGVTALEIAFPQQSDPTLTPPSVPTLPWADDIIAATWKYKKKGTNRQSQRSSTVHRGIINCQLQYGGERHSHFIYEIGYRELPDDISTTKKKPTHRASIALWTLQHDDDTSQRRLQWRR
ncbi:uncharacterized protein PG998_015144 [Apiospora kogelbergensis]|uniref:uncharacterized protein n=1 Tax=Apiospora kogelbergensis TaxID=1337665 RepID=UPI003132194C